MQTANNVLHAIHKLGMKQAPVTRIYRQLYNENLYLGAYSKIYQNDGALTIGTNEETIDGMNLQRIQSIIDDMQSERFRWSPSRRTWRDKKNGGKRPLGIPNFREKLVQEVLRALLSAYYEPQFSRNSHGYRPNRGCHTALEQVAREFRGTVWFIEGDIKGCFDNINHDILIEILRKSIHDNRLLNLIESGLKAGIVEDWEYEATHSGTPQGGILSPLLSNIYLNELDTFMDTILLPKWNRGRKRRANPKYDALNKAIRKARERNETTLEKELKAKRREIPSQDTQDPSFRRLKYVRYADDFILGFIGSKAEAIEIRDEISEFLSSRLRLEMSQEKTLITHARTEKAKFLGYEISTYHANDKVSESASTHCKRRSINGHIRLGIPYGLIDKKCQHYKHNNVVQSEPALTVLPVAEIIQRYQDRYRGIAQFYKYAVDRNHMSKLKGVMQEALVKTLAHKLKISVRQVYRRYSSTIQIDGKSYKILRETVETEKRTYEFIWGGIPLNRVRPGSQPIDDSLPKVSWSIRSDLVQRLKANKCEICGNTENIEVHHIRKLSDLKKRWRGRKDKPLHVKSMIARNRKTLVVCRNCHHDIHAGKLSRKT